MKKYLSRRKKKTILTSLALGFCLLMPWYRAEAVTSYTTPNGLFRLDYYGAGESFTGKWYLESLPEEEKVCLLSQGELPDWQKQQINCAADYWDGLLKHTAFPRQPVILAITVNQGDRSGNGRENNHRHYAQCRPQSWEGTDGRRRSGRIFFHQYVSVSHRWRAKPL